jgi:glycosyltransferase involved in cell wall biosynthesis
MRIAMVGPFGFHPKKTMRARAFRLARALAQREHQVQLFMPPWHTPDKGNTSWTEDGVQIRYVALRGGHFSITRRLIRETLTFAPDIVHCFKPKAYSGLAAWWFWRFHRRRLRLVVDSDDWEGWGGWNELEAYSPLQKRFFAWQERWGMRHCHTLTVASRALETLALAHRVPAHRVHYVPNGPGIAGAVDPERLARKRATLQLSKRPVVLLYSRLFEFDTQRLVDVLAQVHEKLPDLAILSIGAGLFEDDATLFRHQLQAGNLLDAVVDVGWATEAELPALLAAADVGLYLIDDTLLNRTKCPVKLADMLSVGLPVVAEAVGQVTAYVRHRETGLVYECGDVRGLAGGVLALLADAGLKNRLGAAARQHIQEHFSWNRLAHDLEQAYA